MSLWSNSSGKALSDKKWLQIHHNAKLPERKAFSLLLSSFSPKSIVDLGCAHGLWMELLNEVMPIECSFIGIDYDDTSIESAIKRSSNWTRHVEFLKLDLNKEAHLIPPADLTLAFNILCYISDIDDFICEIHSKSQNGRLAIRQYDGDSIRFGPMNTGDRQRIERNLRLSLEGNRKFNHFDMDRVFNAINSCEYRNKEISFELFARESPFDEYVYEYYVETLKWTEQFLSGSTKTRFDTWLQDNANSKTYFYEVDLVSILS